MCQTSSISCSFFALILLCLCFKVNSKSSAYFARRLDTFQREFSEQRRRQPPEDPSQNRKQQKRHNERIGDKTNAKQQQQQQQIICINGKTVQRKCVCKLDYFGEHCERKMFCKGFERENNRSCVQCNDNYSGALCARPKCRNGGVEHSSEQRCQCLQPYSGDFCEALKVEDVYRFYNTKAALVGPLGILTVLPMLFCFYMCEKKARTRQVSRIQKSWSEQRKASIQSAHIASLLAEKA